MARRGRVGKLRTHQVLDIDSLPLIPNQQILIG